jgi:hypothetical protein
MSGSSSTKAGVSRRRALSLIAASCGIVLRTSTAQPNEGEVDLALVLAIDCSFSVDASEYALQMQGLGKALQSAAVFEAISKGPKQKIAISAFHWSDDKTQQMVLPWTVISTATQAASAGEFLAVAPRLLAEGGTSISSALLYAQALLQQAPASTRKVVDLSTDGRNNIGVPANTIRNRLVAAGLTINALAITNEWETLNIYLENQIIGGEGSFVIKAVNYEGYADAILRKLVREIIGPGIS